jgi:hypothetical protein
MRANASDLEIELTERETALVSQIDFDPSAISHNADSWRVIADAMEELMRSLLKRNAIPEARRRFFEEPAYFIGGRGLSHLQVFEKNGTYGPAIFRHGNFLKYLRYFVFGPDLPKPVIETFLQKVVDCGEPFTSGDTISVGDFARQLTRSHGLDAGIAAEEFYKLALDCRLDAGKARFVRDTVKKLRLKP